MEWDKVSSWSPKLLLVVVSLPFLLGLVCIVGSRTSTWVSFSYHSLLWGAIIPPSSSSNIATTESTTRMTGLSTDQGGDKKHLEMHPKVESVSVFNQSSSPQMVSEIFQVQRPDERNQEDLRIPINHHGHDVAPAVMKEAGEDSKSAERLNGSGVAPIITKVAEEDSKSDRINGSNVDPVIMKVAEENSKSERINGSDVAPTIIKMQKNHTQLERLEAGLAKIRAAIREAAHQKGNQTSDFDYVPEGPMYWNAQAFHRSYLVMEKQFKIFIYEEGEPPLFHDGPCRSIYSMEGNFIHQIEMDKRFRTRNPEEAYAFFLPFSVTQMVRFVYVPNSHDIGPIKQTVIDYVNLIAGKYPYWNRSLAADHFMLSCHDWGPLTSSYVPHLYKNGIRVLCNANTSEGFNPAKDASFPEINLRTGETKGLIGGPPPSCRPILAFFAGGLHGPIRPLLLEHWKNKDEDVKVYEYLPKGLSYYDMMKKSKYCICPSGYEVASPRIVEAIYAGCVPVLISDHYVPPFSDVLNWKSFSVEVPVSEIPNLKRILLSIPTRQYKRMQRRGLKVRRHFEVNFPPKRFDVYHMILHSVWLRRLNVRIHDLRLQS
ncbi:PREDICTED: probable glycosyltransferase At5g03795 isoform X2 [Nelumbo nucifera]|uniref:Probable glycosyltransferase At5g03795 isoform X2 n=1 Tax=Nelumbo nucifera TaxID=4432 RepID=A0A1U7YS83_NELNU|nr:PREDICTED: probable glycosyltransferase At5g03795 isoform X2 [Nelumbo nucifera]